MRRFRFVGDSSTYGKGFIESGQIVDEDYSKGITDPITFLAERFPNDWEEVFEEPKPLHKDTDLGYFSIEIIKSFISVAPYLKKTEDPSNELFVKDCIGIAKELIKQLDQETK